MPVLLHSDLAHLPPPKVGKVREVYDLGAEMLIVATDRLSAFDVVLASGIPGKGQILNQMSAFWFGHLNNVCPNHFISSDDSVIEAKIGSAQAQLRGRATLAKKAKPLPIECVARGYITGSLYKDYLASGGDTHGFHFPAGLLDCAKLPEPIFTPATKAQDGEHDENLSWEQAVDIVGKETAERVKNWTLELYNKAAEHAFQQGIILADTKFEFGETEDGIILIDEALTPDSSRYWEKDKYEPGRAQDSFDKQFVRNYLIGAGLRGKAGVVLPDAIIQKTVDKYVEAYRRIVGSEPILA